MKPKYRVEAFIVPKCIERVNTEVQRFGSNEIDDVKAANKLKLVECETPEPEEPIGMRESVNDEEKSKSPNENYDIGGGIYDVPCAAISGLSQIDENSKFKPCESLPLQNIAISRKSIGCSGSLESIDERGETEGILEEFCFYECTDGTTQRPEEISEEIFKDNWLRRLSSLRERESLLRDKEILLQERERLLFKKERELRILERQLRDKLKQVDLYAKRWKSSRSVEAVGNNFDIKTRSSDGSSWNLTEDHRLRNSVCAKRNCMEKSEEEREEREEGEEERFRNLAESKIVDPLGCRGEQGRKSLAALNAQEIIKQSILSLNFGSRCEEKTTKNPPNFGSSPNNAASIGGRAEELAHSHENSSKLPVRNFRAGSIVHGSLTRCKPRPRITYDDLDSTLSADIGDSSFVVTSGKFNPEIFEKPRAFRRSASERRTRLECSGKNLAYNSVEPLHRNERQGTRGGNPTEQDNVFKRLSENILISRDRSTKYLNYGLIDPAGVSIEEAADKARYSYLNLERGARNKDERDSTSAKERRRISWNEETNEWLQKKRQAYNLATKSNLPNDNSENKENLNDAGVECDKSEKLTKKKDSKRKKFAIFR